MPKRVSNRLSSVENHNGDEHLEFDSVFDQFESYVSSVALRLLGDQAAVDDLVQDVFLSCYEKFATLQSMAHAKNWLVKVTVRKAGRILRRKKIARFLHLSHPDCPEPSLPLVSADERAQLVILYSILTRLPIDVRIAWCLRYLEGARVSEIAYACECSVSTAKRRIREGQDAVVGEAQHE